MSQTSALSAEQRGRDLTGSDTPNRLIILRDGAGKLVARTIHSLSTMLLRLRPDPSSNADGHVAPPNRHDWAGGWRWHCEGDGIMSYDADGEAVDLLDHLLSKQRRYAERRSSSQEVLPAIKMLIGDWHIDELGVLTREITARD